MKASVLVEWALHNKPVFIVMIAIFAVVLIYDFINPRKIELPEETSK